MVAVSLLVLVALWAGWNIGSHKDTNTPQSPKQLAQKPTEPVLPSAVPTASLTVNPETVQRGQSTTLAWQTSDATEVTIDGMGPIPASGSQQVTPSDSIAYNLIAKGPGGTQTATAQVIVTPPPPQPRAVPIGNGALTIPASNFTYYRLTVPAGARNVKVAGRFVATGGTGNDVEVYLLSEDQFTNWQNQHATPTFYNSGRATVGDLNATLPDEAGTYYLVFNNRFSVLTPKAVQFNATLTYYQ